MRISVRQGVPVSRAIARWHRDLTVPSEGIRSEPLTLAQLLEPLRRRWYLVAALALVGAGAAVLLARYQDPVYQSTALVEVQGVNDNFLNLREMAVTANDNLMEPYLQTQVKIIESPELLARVAAKLRLEQREEFTRRENGSAAARRETVLKELSRRVMVRIAGLTRVIEVVSESTDPALAGALSNTVAREYIDYMLERRMKYNRETTGWLNGQLRDLKASFERSEQELQQYARSAGLVFTSDQSVAEARLRQSQESLSKAQTERVLEQSRYERALSSPADALPEVLDDAALKDYQVKLTDLKRQLAERSSTLEPAHYRIREIRAQIVELETALERGRANVLKRIRNQFESAVKREQMESAAYSAQAGVVAAEAAKSVRYKSLKQEVDSNRQLYEAMLQRVKEAGIASAARATNVQLLSEAPVPVSPAKPRVLVYCAAGLMSGLAIGIALCFLLRNTGRGIPSEDGGLWACRELGAIPYAFEQRSLPAPAAAEGLAAGDVSALGPELASQTVQLSAVADCAREALAAILLPLSPEDQPRVLAVTSAGEGEGKTTVACNFALALARMNQRVLLVDANVRGARLYEIFGIPNGPGFSDLIARHRFAGEEGDLEWRFAADLSDLGMSGLHVLPSGTAGGENLLSSPEIPAVLDRLRRHFDFVVIDAPALTRLEARSLSRAADGAVVVAGARQASRAAVETGLRRLAEDGTNVLGVVVNDCGPRRISLLSRGVRALPAPFGALSEKSQVFESR